MTASWSFAFSSTETTSDLTLSVATTGTSAGFATSSTLGSGTKATTGGASCFTTGVGTSTGSATGTGSTLVTLATPLALQAT